MATTQRRRRRHRREADFRTRSKPCELCQSRIERVDYKNVTTLRRYMSDRAKIRTRRVTGLCGTHQRAVAAAIKNAREVALLPYSTPRQ